MKPFSILTRSSAASLAAAASTLLATGLVQAEVYRCADAAGKVTYQAQPCPDSSASKPVNVGAGTPGAPTPAAPQAAPRPASPARRFVIEDGAVAAPPAPRPAATAAPAGRGRVLEPTTAPAPQGAAQWGRDADVLVVSGYQFSAATTQVHVNHPDRPVLLVLTSYHDTQWKVLPAPGTRIKAVVAAASDGRSTVQAPPQVPVAYDELPYAVETGNLNFRELIGKLHGRYGVEKVTAFRGGYSLPALVPVNGPYLPDPNLSLEGLRPEVPKARISFDLVSVDGRRLPWTNTGPRDGKRYTGIVRGGVLGAQRGGAMVVSENGGEAYALEGNGGTLLWFPQGPGGASQKLVLPKNLPELSWGSGMAWDTRKGVLAIVSFGGEGYFYRYDTRKREWLGARSLNNRDLFGLAVDAATGNYVGISDAAELLLFNGNGEVDEVLPLAKVLPDLNTTFDRGNARPQGLTVAAHGGVVAIVNVRDASVTHIWTYELASRRAQLTYKVVD